jgi:hypothetical protein
VFSPLAFTRTVTRITPVQTISDDLSWVKENHTIQFGGTIRLVKNNRVGFSNAFDNAIANPSFYSGGAGASLSTPIRHTFIYFRGSRCRAECRLSFDWQIFAVHRKLHVRRRWIVAEQRDANRSHVCYAGIRTLCAGHLEVSA